MTSPRRTPRASARVWAVLLPPAESVLCQRPGIIRLRKAEPDTTAPGSVESTSHTPLVKNTLTSPWQFLHGHGRQADRLICLPDSNSILSSSIPNAARFAITSARSSEGMGPGGLPAPLSWAFVHEYGRSEDGGGTYRGGLLWISGWCRHQPYIVGPRSLLQGAVPCWPRCGVGCSPIGQVPPSLLFPRFCAGQVDPARQSAGDLVSVSVWRWTRNTQPRRDRQWHSLRRTMGEESRIPSIPGPASRSANCGATGGRPSRCTTRHSSSRLLKNPQARSGLS